MSEGELGLLMMFGIPLLLMILVLIDDIKSRRKWRREREARLKEVKKEVE